MDLGLSDSDFWDLTFEELDALIERRKLLDQRTDYRNLQIVCAMYNSQRTSEKQKVLKPEDFMAFGPRPAPSRKPDRAPSEKEIELARAQSKALFQTMDAYASRCGLNNAGEQEARERIAREKAEAESGVGRVILPDSGE